MNQKYLNKLEYNKIIDNLVNYAKTYIGKEKCNSHAFDSFNPTE